MRSVLAALLRWAVQFRERHRRARRVVYVEGDELPAELPRRDVMVAREEDTLWVAGLNCPCGCGKRLELMLLPEVRPRWIYRWMTEIV